jgi:hypothetical protein
MRDKMIEAVVEEITKKLADEGKLIAAGWTAYRHLAMHPEAPPDQIRECRIAYYAGAQHLFGSLTSMMDADAEPTDADMNKMELMHRELLDFIAEFQSRMSTKQ